MLYTLCGGYREFGRLFFKQTFLQFGRKLPRNPARRI
jgi:hypothetical protein